MKKKIIKCVSTVLAAMMVSGIACAEQPKAQEYRNIMSSGTFYIEYESGFAKQTLAVQDGKRMSYTIHKNSGISPLSFVPIIGVVSLFAKNESKIPNALYQDGKYYHFLSKKEALVADDKILNDPNIDPEEGWSSIKSDLTFPEAFTVFAPNDAFNSAVDYKPAEFVESGTEKIKDKQYTYDKYAKKVKSLTGTDLGDTLYTMYYNDKGELVKIKTTFKTGSQEEEIPFSEIKVIKITNELPKNIIGIPENCKIFAAGLGDMNDLLDLHVPADEQAN